MRLVLDAMGGDHAPQAPVEAAVRWVTEAGGQSRLILIGDEVRMKRQLAQSAPAISEAAGRRLELIHAPEQIRMNESPVRAIRSKSESSVVKGLEMVKQGEAEAFISAGSTGALMAGSLLILGRLAGLRRPAFPGLIPRAGKKPFLLLDIGANVDCTAEDLRQFAHLGDLYVQTVLQWDTPGVALLNIGVESNKGTEAIKQAYELLEQDPHLRFIGNIEGRDLFQSDQADIVICDGFVGNVVLKMIEGFGTELFRQLQDSLDRSLRSKAGALLLKPALKRLVNQYDHTEHGGMPLLGVDGVCMKCHGSADAKTFYHGLKGAQAVVEDDLMGELKDLLAGEDGIRRRVRM